MEKSSIGNGDTNSTREWEEKKKEIKNLAVAADLYFFTVCNEWNLAVRSQSTTSTAYGPCTLAVRIFAKCQM